MQNQGIKNRIGTNLKYGFFGSLISFLIILISKEMEFLPEVLIAGFLTGFFDREIENTLSKTKLRKLNFRKQIFLRPVIYSSVMLIIIVFIILIKISINNECTLISAIGEKSFWNYLFYSNFYLVVMLILTVSMLVSFIWQVNLLLGPGVLIRFVAGKYETPKKENKIFLFMDLNSSVRIAEKLGTEKYSDLLKDFFLEITDPIVKYNGQIFQYVGDEVVLYWDQKNKEFNGYSVDFVFSVIEAINSRSDYYKNKYGLVPDFKVGIHCGETIVREVGEIKKEIVFHGDLLNTTSRIRSVCNKLGKKVLITKKLYECISHNESYNFNFIGEVDLKGKKEKVELIEVELK